MWVGWIYPHVYLFINVFSLMYRLGTSNSKQSLWVKWINEVRLKGQSIWEVGVDYNASRGWEQMLALKETR